MWLVFLYFWRLLLPVLKTWCLSWMVFLCITFHLTVVQFWIHFSTQHVFYLTVLWNFCLIASFQTWDFFLDIVKFSSNSLFGSKFVDILNSSNCFRCFKSCECYWEKCFISIFLKEMKASFLRKLAFFMY